MDLAQVVAAYDRCEGMDPDLIATLIQRLPDDSMFVAHVHDPDEWQNYFGWGTERQMLAGIYDLDTILVRGSINWQKGKEPKLQPWDRPWREKPKKADAPKDDAALLKAALAKFGGAIHKL